MAVFTAGKSIQTNKASFRCEESFMTMQHLIHQCVALQGKGDHLAVVSLLESQLVELERNSEKSLAANFYHLYGVSLYRLNRLEEAYVSYERGLKLHSEFPALLNSMGFVLQDLGRLIDAREKFVQALTLAPEMAMARLNLGMIQLKLGDFANGWENYEARWTGSAESSLGNFVRPACPLPQWNGESNTHDLRLLVIAEQGFGDTFHFSRYLKDISLRFRKVGFICSAPTLRLMEWSYKHGIVLFTHFPLDYGTWDLQCSLMSLPRACQTRLETIPGNTPYLSVPIPAKQHWLERLNTVAPERMRVGVAWAGRKAHQYDDRRSLSFEKFLPILKTPFVTWISLQKWATEEVRPQIPIEIDWVDWTEELTDFADTAALIDGLDLVISIDSSMVHLAGALNKPVWMLNRYDSEWRWLNGRVDSPWYPSVRIFNQSEFGIWDDVIANISQALLELPIPQIPAKPRSVRALPISVSSTIQNFGNHFSTNGLTIEQAIQLAGQHHVGGRLVQAEEVLRHILKIDPKHAHALHLLGVVTYQAGQSILALDLMRQAIASNPQVALFQTNFAEMCRQQGRLEEAIEHGNYAIGLDPTLSIAHCNLGIALYDAKKYDAAQIAHEKALEIQPDLVQAINNLGSIERARNNSLAAIGWYQKALKINGEYEESLINLGAVLVEANRAEEALPLLLKLLDLRPNSSVGLRNLGLAYFKLKDFDKAESLSRRALILQPEDSQSKMLLVSILQERGNFVEAISVLKAHLDLNDGHAHLWAQLGWLYMERTHSELAQAAFKKALALERENKEAMIGMATLCLRMGEDKRAKYYLKKLIKQDPGNLTALSLLAQAQKK
jgi:tetratricopeptide (TPR) repeat protein